MKHPLVGRLVTASFSGHHSYTGHRVALVENVVFPKRGSASPRIICRLFSVDFTPYRWDDDYTEGEHLIPSHCGKRLEVKATALKDVRVSGDDGWVAATDFLEWSE